MSAEGARRRSNRFVRGIESRLAHLAIGAYHRPTLAVLVIAALTCGSYFGSRQLVVNPDLAELLPQHFTSVRNLHRLRDEFGGIGHLTVAVRGDAPATLEAFADALAPELEALGSVRYVEHRRPVEFFSERALYFMDLVDLQTVRARFAAREKWERLRANPLYIDLEGEPAPSIDVSDIEAKYRERGGVGGASDEDWDEQEAYFIDRERGLLVLFIKPAALASDLQFARKLVTEVSATVDRVAGSVPGADALQIDLSGRYKKRIDMQEVVERDVRVATVAGILLVVGFLFLHFRRLSSMVLIVVPLAVGLYWTYGFAGHVLGSLNILTAFVGAILLGVGIDIGIHLISRYERDASRSSDPDDALHHAFGRTGRAATAATFTTVAGFASLAISEFRVFAEFGIMASAGLSLVLLSYLLCLPALIRLRNVLFHPRPPEPVENQPMPGTHALLRSAPWLFWLTVLGAFGAVVWIPAGKFDYDFAALEARQLPSYSTDQEVHELLGHSQSPLVVMAGDLDDSREVAAALVRRSEALGDDSALDRVTTLADLVPPNQDEKYVILQDLRRFLEEIDPEGLTDEERERVAELLERTAAQPFGVDDLPAAARRPFTGIGGDAGGLVLAFANIPLTDGSRIQALADEVRDIPAGGGKVSAAGEAMVLADVLDSVFREAPRTIGLASLVVVLTLWLLLGRLQLAVVSALPALITLAVTIGLLPLAGVQLNYLNIVILPALLGIGVDGGAHLLTRVEEGGPLADAVAHTSTAIIGAIVTTALGFAALLVAGHPGLRSLAHVALLGLSVNLIATTVLLPAGIALWSRGSKLVKRSGSFMTVVTVGRAGLAPIGPGSLGALMALPIAWLLRDVGAAWWLVILSAATALSIWFVSRYLTDSEAKDPQEVVLDETIGCAITLAFVPWSWPWVVAGYALFRLFDIWKPGPVRYLDRRGKGAIGVMGDDVVAGLMAGAILWGLVHLVGA